MHSITRLGQHYASPERHVTKYMAYCISVFPPETPERIYSAICHLSIYTIVVVLYTRGICLLNLSVDHHLARTGLLW